MSGKLERYARDQARQIAQLQQVSALPATALAFPGTILDAMDAAGMTGPSWAAWRTWWKAVYALPMDAAELAVFRAQTGRAEPPPAPVREAWLIVGRRGGKTRNDALGAMYAGTRRDYRDVLASGERGVIPVIAADRKQALQVLGYIKGLATLACFAPHVGRVLKESITLTTGVAIEVHTASYRTTRGYTIPGVVADEVAFWSAEDSAQPDTEILAALRPGMATLPDALLLGSSTPYGRRGELYRAFDRYYGREDPRVLVWVAPSRVMNPALDAGVVAQAYEDDPVAAAAEYGAEFRRDIEAFIAPEAIAAVTVTGRHELAPVADVGYVAWTDPSGGSQDSWTLAIAHAEGGRAVLDCLRETRPPFSPDAVATEYAALLRTYGLANVVGDRYGGEFPRELFAKAGIAYQTAPFAKSDLYRELLPGVNAGRVELLEHPRLKAQLVGLERRVSRVGKDSIDHAPGGRDDVANAAAGALVLALGAGDGPPLGEEIVEPAEDWQEVFQRTGRMPFTFD